MLVYLRVTPSIKFLDASLYSWVERGTVRVKYLAKEHNTKFQLGLELRPVDLDASTLNNHEATVFSLQIINKPFQL